MSSPSVGANYFFYASEYYVFANGGWYVSPGHSGTTEYPRLPGEAGGVRPLHTGSRTGDSGGKSAARRIARSGARNPEGHEGRSVEESIVRAAGREGARPEETDALEDSSTCAGA